MVLISNDVRYHAVHFLFKTRDFFGCRSRYGKGLKRVFQKGLYHQNKRRQKFKVKFSFTTLVSLRQLA